MTATQLHLAVIPAPRTRTVSDRLEILQTLIAGPGFDPMLRDDIIRVPRGHAVYGWGCGVPGCERSRDVWRDFCCDHCAQWYEVQREGGDINEFFRRAEPLQPRGGRHLGPCTFCPDNPAYTSQGLCYLHAYNLVTWASKQRRLTRPDDYRLWAAAQRPFPAFGRCVVPVCPDTAGHWVGLCPSHFQRYNTAKRPGGAKASFAAVPRPREHRKRPPGERPAMTVTYTDEDAFRRWCMNQDAFGRTDGVLTLLGLRPLVRAEFKWALFHHAQGPSEGARWPISVVQRLVNECQRQKVDSLAGLDVERAPQHPVAIARKMLHHLRQVYFTRQDTKEAGFIESDHYGVRLAGHESFCDISGVSQRWLRDLLWDYLDMRFTTNPPRNKSSFTRHRRGCVELSAYLEVQAPGGGHDPKALTKGHMLAFVADQRHRAEHGLQPLGTHERRPGYRKPVPVNRSQVAVVFNGARAVLRAALESGETERIGLDRAFVLTLPGGGNDRYARRRRPFSDEVAQALAAEENLELLAGTDVDDRGLRDIWETIVVTGRRAGEVLNLHLDCIARYQGVPMLWHDQTKVGHLDEGIRISERIYQCLEQRQAKTEARFVQRHGRPPTPTERRDLALFPRRTANRFHRKPVSYGWFHKLFRQWVIELNLPHTVAHQARHTLATNLLKAGADLIHVRRYLGHVSYAMTEHYVHIANTDPRLSDALQAVWVGGPGSPEPGMLLSGAEPMTREEAEAMLIDLTRKSTPADGGFCTFQPVVNGGACPWNLDCHNCDKFVMTGADLVYWHRKREQWRMLAERAPDETSRDYLHQVFDPTARAIDGLERALAAAGLLDEALSLDLRRPQDYYGRVWSTAFRASELVHQEDGTDLGDIGTEAG